MNLVITIKLTEGEIELLEALREKLQLSSRSQTLRAAVLDFALAHMPHCPLIDVARLERHAHRPRRRSDIILSGGNRKHRRCDNILVV